MFWAYRQYVVRSGRFILGQQSAPCRGLACGVVLLPWLAILALCVVLLVQLVR